MDNKGLFKLKLNMDKKGLGNLELNMDKKWLCSSMSVNAAVWLSRGGGETTSVVQVTLEV